MSLKGSRLLGSEMTFPFNTRDKENNTHIYIYIQIQVVHNVKLSPNLLRTHPSPFRYDIHLKFLVTYLYTCNCIKVLMEK